MKTIATQDRNVGQAHRADEIFKKSGFGQTDSQTEFVLIQSKTLTVKDGAFRAAIADVTKTVTPFKTIKNFRSPLDPAHGDQISVDGHTAIVGWDMKGNDTVAQKNIAPITTATAAVAKRHPGLYIGEAGSASSNKALNAMFNEQLKQAGIRSVPLTLLILVLVFGSIVDAGVPPCSRSAWRHRAVAPSRLAPDGPVGVGGRPPDRPAVGVDYALFYLKRERKSVQRARASCRTRGCGRDVGPLGADLRADRHGRDGRAVLLRRPHVPLVRRRHDHGRRDRDARLAHRAPGASVEARRPRREGPHPVPRPAAPPER
jgi:hypothetical protein